MILVRSAFAGGIRGTGRKGFFAAPNARCPWGWSFVVRTARKDGSKFRWRSASTH